MINKIFRILASIVVGLLALVPTFVAHADTYSTVLEVKVKDTTGGDRTNVQVIAPISISSMISAGYFDANGLNTNLVDSTNTSVPYMLVNNKLNFVISSLGSNEEKTFYLRMKNVPSQTAFKIIPGEGGNVTAADAALIEPGSNFAITQNGYYDSTATSNATMVGKDSAVRVSVTGGTVTADLYVVNTITTNITRTSWQTVSANNTMVGTSYAASHDADTGVNYAGGYVGQEKGSIPDSWYIWRQLLQFNIGSLPAGYNILSARLWTNYVWANPSNTTLYLLNSNGAIFPTTSSTYPTLGGATTIYGIETSWSTGYGAFSLNAAGVATLASATNVTYALRTLDDIDSVSVPPNDSIYWGINGAGQETKLEITYTVPQPSISLTYAALTTGTHTITVSGNSTGAYLIVDGTVQDSDAGFAGLGIPANSNTWTFMAGNSWKYLNYQIITVGGVEKLEYRPASVISGTTLVDEDGTQNGVINYGTNNGLTITIGSTSSGGGTTPTPFNPNAPGGISPTAPLPTNWYGGCSNLAALPMYSTFNAKAVEIGMTTCTLYIIILMTIVACVGLGVLLFTGSGLLAGLGMAFTMGAGVSTTVIPGWMTFAFIIIIIAILYLARQH